jgi:hypothetical protein
MHLITLGATAETLARLSDRSFKDYPQPGPLHNTSKTASSCNPELLGGECLHMDGVADVMATRPRMTMITDPPRYLKHLMNLGAAQLPGSKHFKSGSKAVDMANDT